MKQTKLALSAVMIVAVGLVGANFVTGSEMTEQEKLVTYQDSGLVYGHVTVVHADSDGNIISYTQTDNLVANNGKDCMAQLIFGNTAGSNCDGTADSKFTTIALFNGQSFPVTMNATTLLTVDIATSGLAITNGVATPTQTAVATGTGYTDGTGGDSDISTLFTAGGTQTVDGAVLFNAATDAVFAGQNFNSVSLLTSDTLTVTWTITLG